MQRLILLFTLALSGCSHQAAKPKPLEYFEPTVEKQQVIQEAIKSNQALKPVESIQQAEEKDIPLEEEGLQKTFNISLDNAPLSQVFRILSIQSKKNILVHPRLSGTMSLFLNEVTLEQALEVIRLKYGFEYKEVPNGFMMVPPTLETRIFRINYLDVSRTGNSSTSVDSGTGDTGGDGGGATGGTAGGGISVTTTNTSEFWTELQESLTALISEGEGKKLIINRHSGMVVVKGYPSDIREVASFLESIQNIMHRQVIIEAKILEIQLSDAFQTGVNWGAVIDQSEFVANVTQGTFVGNNMQTNPLPALSDGGFFSAAVQSGNFTALIDLLQTQGNVSVLSSPRISTLNNQKAIIKVGQDDYFVTGISTNVLTSATGTTTTPEYTFEKFFSGIALDVTPQIAENNDITLHVHPSINSVNSETKTLDGKEYPFAVSKVRATDSIIRARSGQVIVIGGLIEESQSISDSKTPLFGDVPGVGELFKKTNNSGSKTELVILLRPIVIGTNGAEWNQSLQQSLGQ